MAHAFEREDRESVDLEVVAKTAEAEILPEMPHP